MSITDHQAQYFAYELMRQFALDSEARVPSHVLGRCQWRKDDCLAVANLSPAPRPPGQREMFAEEGT
jgi:hypothetical protein